MKKAIGLICTIVILAAGQSFAAKVSNVELSWQDGFTVARVDVQGTVRFSHQSEVAKDGRPFRVIVDVLSATHHLGRKTFADLPPCPVTGIRSSQYAVQPEKVVRLVFDMSHETVYRIQSDEKSVSIFFPDQSGATFAAWSSTAVVAGSTAASAQPKLAATATPPALSRTEPSRKSAGELNKSITGDRLASLQSDEPVPASKPVPVPTVKADRPKPTVMNPVKQQPMQASLPVVARPDTISESVPHLPDFDPSMMKPAQPMSFSPLTEPISKVATPSPVVTAPAPSPKPAEKKAAPSSKPKVQPTVTAAKPAASPVPTTVAMASPAGSVQPKTQPTPKASAKPVAEPKPAAKATAQPAATEKKKQTTKPTSRFRRSPTRPTKIKGTLVAEFPKRLVIKYSGNNNRDPFATLIDETKQYNSPIERRVPNVEGLRLVGIIEAEIGNSALFEDKDGYGYILKEGDKVQKGYVLRVREDRVFFQIFEYGWSRTVALNLDKE